MKEDWSEETKIKSSANEVETLNNLILDEKWEMMTGREEKKGNSKLRG